MSNQNDLKLISRIIKKLDENKVSRFAYTDAAFEENNIEGTEIFDVSSSNNIPLATDMAEKLLDTGMRAQGASIKRESWNHFIGRMSYNINKLVQKVSQFFNLTAKAWAHNAFEYDPQADYATGDICYLVETVKNVRVYTYYQRVSTDYTTIQDIPPTSTHHWTPMQNKTSVFSLLPFSAPGYQHKYTIVDLEDENVWHKVSIELNAIQVLIEAYCDNADLIILNTGKTDIVIDDTNPTIRQIGFSREGNQVVLWLRGGKSYALWNSYGEDFVIGIPTNECKHELNLGTVHAKLKTPDAINYDEAPNLGQVAGALPLPRTLSAGSQIISVRTPGSYVVSSPSIANTISGVPIPNPGPFTLTVEGIGVTTQKFVQHSTGKIFIQTIMDSTVVVPWYLLASKADTGVMIKGLYKFNIDMRGHLMLSYLEETDMPEFEIVDKHLIARFT
jgi:hypothetical protein